MEFLYLSRPKGVYICDPSLIEKAPSIFIVQFKQRCFISNKRNELFFCPTCFINQSAFLEQHTPWSATLQML